MSYHRVSRILLLLLMFLFGLATFTAAQESSDNRWLIFLQQRDIYRMRLDSSEIQNLTQSADGINEIKALSPDHQWLYFEEDLNIYRISSDGSDGSDGSERQQLTSEGDLNVFGSLSPDGEWIFFNRDAYDRVYRMRSDGSEVSRVPAMPHFPLAYGWSPDGAWMYFFLNEPTETRPYGLYRMSVDGNVVENVTESLTEGIRFIDFSLTRGFSPDGEWLIFSCWIGERQQSSCRMHYDGSEAQALTTSGSSFFMDWSPDGQWLYFSSYEGEDFSSADLYRMRLDGSEVQQITNFSERITYYGFKPDENHLLIWLGEYSSGRKDLYRINVDGSDAELLFSTDLPARFTQYSPDEQWIMLSFGDFGQNAEDLYRITAAGENLENMTHSPGYYYPLFWTPDGEWLLYVLGETTSSPIAIYGQIYRLNINTLEIQMLTPEPASYVLGQFYLVQGD